MHQERNEECATLQTVIRRFRPDDADALVAIWEKASTVAHPFLDAAFVAREKHDLTTQHLHNAETWVLEANGCPAGFIALIGDEIGGLFVDPSHHGQGLGRTLVDYAVGIKGSLRVEVFEKNSIGRRFYQQYGFIELDSYDHESSGEVMLRLTMPGRQTPT